MLFLVHHTLLFEYICFLFHCEHQYFFTRMLIYLLVIVPIFHIGFHYGISLCPYLVLSCLTNIFYRIYQKFVSITYHI